MRCVLGGFGDRRVEGVCWVVSFAGIRNLFMLVTFVTNSGADLSASGIGRLITVCEPPLTDAQNNAFFFLIFWAIFH
jgi:hypothetical protein